MKPLYVLPLLVAALPVAGATVPRADSRPQFNYLTVNDGLSSFVVTSLLQIFDGRIMIGTYDGLNFFDGYAVASERHSVERPEGLINNRIVSMELARDSSVWLGLDGGLMRYDPLRNSYTDYTASIGIETRKIRALCPRASGEVWIGCERGLVRAIPDGGSGYTFNLLTALEGLDIYAIREDRRGDMWVGTTKGLFIYGSGSLRRVEPFAGCSVRWVECDPYGMVWVSWTGGVMSSRDGEIFTPLVFGGRPAIPVTRTVRDAPDHLWVGSGVEGLFSVRLDSAGHAVGWEHYPRSDRFGAISSDEIHCMWVDRSRVLWVGTRLGLNMANISPPEFYTFTPLLRSGYSVLGSNGRVINALFIDRSERLWINSMYDGTFRYDFRSGRLEDISRAVTSSSVSRIIQTRDGTIWVAAQEGVWRITEDSRGVLSKRLLRLPGIPVGVASHYRYFLDLIEDGAGDLWIATVDGLIRYSPRTDLAATYTRAHGLASSSAYCLAADASRNIIWMGSSDRGISRIVYRDDSPEIEVQLLSSDTYPFGLGCDQVWALHLDQDGVLWIGTDAGFYRMDAASGISEAIRITAPYLDDAKIVAIIADRQGDLWLNSNQGLYRHTPSTGSTRRYIREDRLQSDTWTEGAACSSDGWIFVGGVNGVNYFNPALFVPNAYAGRPLLTGMKIFNRPVEVGKEYDGRVTLDRSLNVVDRVALSYRQNNFTLEFSSDHYATPSKNRFRYRLEGYDGDWIEVGAGQRFASYARLPSGNYTFIIGKTKCAKNQNEVRQKNLSAPLFFR